MPLPTDSTLNELIHQFSDPLAFLRELVQNSIDAGSRTIDIDVDLQEKGDQATAIIRVQDAGEGMSRHTIETKLLRLFSSSKDQDLTKIGRFGIGFVSVFAIEPDAVVVDTGHHGNFWRILFSPDKSYELFALDEPIEGTLVRIFKTLPLDDAHKLKTRARRVLARWCKHAEPTIFFGDEEIQEPFDVDAALKITHKEQGTTIVMGFAEHEQTFAGYYHSGLTLHETNSSDWPWVRFKIDSRYLEHTLTRDQIIKDGNFHKAHALLSTMALKTLPEALIDRLEVLARAPDIDDAHRHEHHQLLSYLEHFLAREQPFPRAWRRRQILRTIDDEPLDLRALNRAHKKGRLYLSRTHSTVAQHFADDSNKVLLTGPQGATTRLLRRLLPHTPPLLDDQFLSPQDLHLQFHPFPQKFFDLITEHRRAADLANCELLFISFSNLPLTLQDRLAFAADPNRKILRLDHIEHPYLGAKLIYIDAAHPTLRALADLAHDEPEAATFAFFSLLFDHKDARKNPDIVKALDHLLTTAIEARNERRTPTQHTAS